MQTEYEFISEINENDNKIRYAAISTTSNKENVNAIISEVLFNAEKELGTRIDFCGVPIYSTEKFIISINHAPIDVS
jgi:hypothetical protein